MMQALRGPSGVLLGALVAGIAGLVTWLALAPGERAANEVVQVGPAGQSGGSDAIDAENPAPPAQPVPEVLPGVDEVADWTRPASGRLEVEEGMPERMLST